MSFRKSARRTCLRAGHKAVKAIGQEPDRLQANLVNSLSHFLRASDRRRARGHCQRVFDAVGVRLRSVPFTMKVP